MTGAKARSKTNNSTNMAIIQQAGNAQQPQASRTRSAQQAQKELQAQVTETQSLTLVKNLIRVSISTVCHLRGIFPAKCFQERTYAGMKIYQLDAATRDADTDETVVKDQEAYDLTMWLESGVFKAVEHRYLRRMEFIIMSPNHENPREAYSFDLSYPEDQEDEAVIFSGTKVTTVKSAKNELINLIRSLISFGNTLGELPRERILNIKLWYFDDRTPPGWQPDYFREADPSELAFKNGKSDKEIHNKLKIKIGDLQTPHHTLSLRFRGYDTQEQSHREDPDATTADGGSNSSDDSDEDSDGERSCDGRWAKDRNLLKCKAGPEEDEEDDSDDDDEQTMVPETVSTRDVSRMVSGMMTNLNVSSNNAHPSGDNDAGHHQAFKAQENITGYEVRPAQMTVTSEYDAARAWAATQARPTHTSLMAHLEITRELAREFLEKMVHEGLFVKRNFKYHRVDPPQASSHAVQSGERLEDSSPSLSPPPSGTDMDVIIDKPEEVGHGVNGGDGGDDNLVSSEVHSARDDSETQVPAIMAHDTQLHQDRRNRTPSSMPPPAPAGRRFTGQVGRHTPEGLRHGYGGDFATPPIPTPSAPRRVQEKIR
ncbi:Homologue of the meiosis-specific protein HOP1 [Ectocarpus siliculosus]|uniref:Homologue of the meiosis-specific protein HOP1 n=1 Tax=Ectocarpus siliculosus TaxID=2880 RepID=D8LFC6_ECTSI|nr:Homologue of the meiosis-specific protein HOP1 [Ectocarpus siliculosus]|eukprot:CBN75586.1 Homologue of the meiosis-specific protein HOP1 [Ectocarpus siliculosus]